LQAIVTDISPVSFFVYFMMSEFSRDGLNR